jgi:hypothetical protein
MWCPWRTARPTFSIGATVEAGGHVDGPTKVACMRVTRPAELPICRKSKSGPAELRLLWIARRDAVSMRRHAGLG